MIAKRSLFVMGLVALSGATMAQSVLIDPAAGLKVGYFNLGANVSVVKTSTGGYRLGLPGLDSMLMLQLPQGTSWAGYTHVDVRIKNNGTRPAKLELDCRSNNGAGWMSSNVVVGVGEALNVSMPLSTASPLGMRALPSITDAVRSQTASVGSIYPTNISGFFFFNKDNSAADVSVESMTVASHKVPSTAIVDVFGQQRGVSWTGKVLASADLTAARTSEVLQDTLPYSADKYGGVVGGKNYGTSTGFRTVKDNGRWYIATPAGNRFFSVGVNEVGAHAWTPVQGREAMFSALDKLKSQWPDAWSVRDGLLGFIPYQVNLERKYGTGWRAKSETIFTQRMKTWGFNTFGTNSWDTMVSNQRLASTFSGPVVGPHKQLVTFDGRTIHDVFDPQFVADALATCQDRIVQTGGANAMNLGIFIDNEMPWGSNTIADFHYRYGLAVGALKDASSFSHAKLIEILKARYVTVAALNLAWGSSFSSWSALDAPGIDVPATGTVAMQSDFADFGYQFAQKYFSTIKASLRQLGYKGLYLGCRFIATEFVPEVINAAKESCDVISVNVYQGNPSLAIASLKTIDFPVMISEFAFGASDMGRVGMPLYATQTEAARVDAYKRFMEDVKTWPNIVGAHWYRWEDFPTTAKLDSDNMSHGLISIADQPYANLTAQTRLSTIDLMNFLKGQP